MDEPAMDEPAVLFGIVYDFRRSVKSVELIYRVSIDGFGSGIFHEKCDEISGTVSIIKTSRGSVFGGLTNTVWENLPKHNYQRDRKARIFRYVLFFIYSVVNTFCLLA